MSGIQVAQRVSDARRNRLARALGLIAESAPPTAQARGRLELANQRFTLPIEGAGAVVVVLVQGNLDCVLQLRRGEVSPTELVTWAIERIEALNPTLNAVITPIFDRALARAAQPSVGPLAGVPYLLKDLATEMEGVPFSEGSRFLRSYVSRYDSELVRRLQGAGLIVLGKTNTPEFGMVPTAHANDLGSSIRFPASACGLFGLKPTRARNPLGPEYGDVLGGWAVEHALTRRAHRMVRSAIRTVSPRWTMPLRCARRWAMR